MKYDYRCPTCGVVTIDHEFGQTVSKCPRCKSPIKKIITTASNSIWKCPGSYSGTKLK